MDKLTASDVCSEDDILEISVVSPSSCLLGSSDGSQGHIVRLVVRFMLYRRNIMTDEHSCQFFN